MQNLQVRIGHKEWWFSIFFLHKSLKVPSDYIIQFIAAIVWENCRLSSYMYINLVLV